MSAPPTNVVTAGPRNRLPQAATGDCLPASRPHKDAGRRLSADTCVVFVTKHSFCPPERRSDDGPPGIKQMEWHARASTYAAVAARSLTGLTITPTGTSTSKMSCRRSAKVNANNESPPRSVNAASGATSTEAAPSSAPAARLTVPEPDGRHRPVIGKAIVRAVLRGRGADVYVPGYTGAINTAVSVMPCSLRDAIHQLMRADTVLTDTDQSARRIQHTHNSRGQTRCSWTQFSCAAATVGLALKSWKVAPVPPTSLSPLTPTTLRRPSATTTVVALGISRRLFGRGGSPPCEIHLRANVLTRHTGLPTTNPIDV
jgi:hypothetical protein